MKRAHEPLLICHPRAATCPPSKPMNPGGAWLGDKGRNTMWNNAEDVLIDKMYSLIGTQWEKIALLLPGRSADAVRNRYFKQIKRRTVLPTPGMQLSEPTATQVMGECTPSSTDTSATTPPIVTPVAGTQWACAQWALHHRERWSAEEDRLIKESVLKHGFKWRVVAAAFPGRSDSAVRNRYFRIENDGANSKGTRKRGAGEEASSEATTPVGSQVETLPTGGTSARGSSPASPMAEVSAAASPIEPGAGVVVLAQPMEPGPASAQGGFSFLPVASAAEIDLPKLQPAPKAPRLGSDDIQEAWASAALLAEPEHSQKDPAYNSAADASWPPATTVDLDFFKNSDDLFVDALFSFPAVPSRSQPPASLPDQLQHASASTDAVATQGEECSHLPLVNPPPSPPLSPPFSPPLSAP